MTEHVNLEIRDSLFCDEDLVLETSSSRTDHTKNKTNTHKTICLNENKALSKHKQITLAAKP